MTRATLPNKRFCERQLLEFPGDGGAGIQFYADFGIAEINGTWRTAEIFLRPRGGKSGSTMERLYDDIGVLLSRLLQHGDGAEELARSMGRLGGYPGGKEAAPPASIVGVALEAAAELDRSIIHERHDPSARPSRATKGRGPG